MVRAEIKIHHTHSNPMANTPVTISIGSEHLAKNFQEKGGPRRKKYHFGFIQGAHRQN